MTKLIPEPWVQHIAPKLIEQDEMWAELMAPIPAPDVAYPYTPKCDRCGKFTKNLTLVWTRGPEPEPDYEVGDCCRG